MGPRWWFATVSEDRWGRPERYFSAPRPGKIPLTTWSAIQRFENYDPAPEVCEAARKGNLKPMLLEIAEIIGLNPQRSTVWQFDAVFSGGDFVRLCATYAEPRLRRYGLLARVAAGALRALAWTLNLGAIRRLFPVVET